MRKTEKKRGRGRPAYQKNEADRKKVELLASVGNSLQVIAKVLGISEPTLRLYYLHELETAAIMANATVAANLYKQACKDDPKAATAALSWLRYRDRDNWSEYGPMPGTMQHQKTERLGKKEEEAIAARNPDENTTMGSLMAKRQATLQ